MPDRHAATIAPVGMVAGVRPLLACSLAALAAVAIAACGDEEETTTSPATTTATETTVTDGAGLAEERCTEAESPPNIVNVISHGADCGAVADAMAEIRSVSREFRIGDFQCTRVEGTPALGNLGVPRRGELLHLRLRATEAAGTPPGCLTVS